MYNFVILLFCCLLGGCSSLNALKLLGTSSQSGGVQVNTHAAIGDNKKSAKIGNDSSYDMSGSKRIYFNKNNILENNLTIVAIIAIFLFFIAYCAGYIKRSPYDKKIFEHNDTVYKDLLKLLSSKVKEGKNEPNKQVNK